MRSWPRAVVKAVGSIALIVAISLTAGGPAAAATSPAASSWTVYHGDSSGRGVAAGVTAVDTSRPAWTSPAVDGQIYGEPLVWAGRIYVATENDTVYAISARTGAVAWSVHVGNPVPAASLPCGNVTPTVGITGTPVIDQSRNEIFVVADEDRNGSAAHILAGLDTSTGRIELTRDVDPPGAQTTALLQRTGLALDAGQVIFGFGGNYGDCASYQGRVAAVSETGGQPKYFTVDAAAGESQGAIWMGGAAPVVDDSGHVWVSTGNGSVYSDAHAYDDSDSALELSSSMGLLQFFAPADWAQNNSHDLDMSTAPVLLADGRVLLTGKSRIVYLLSGSHLGGIGGQQASLASGCGNDIDGGAAVVGMTAYLPCTTGVIAVQVTGSPAGLRLLWTSQVGGGPPVVAAGLVWTIGQNGVLYGVSPASGQVRQQATIGTPANHFPTPSVGDGLMLAASANRVVAFPAAGPAAPGATTSGTAPANAAGHQPAPTANSAAASTGALPAAAIAGIIIGALVVIGAIGWLFRRRWPRRPRLGGP